MFPLLFANLLKLSATILRDKQILWKHRFLVGLIITLVSVAGRYVMTYVIIAHTLLGHHCNFNGIIGINRLLSIIRKNIKINFLY
jgi:hypothetical protein